MDFLDDEAEATSDHLVPSSQPELTSRARRRRRLDHEADDSDITGEDEYDLSSPPEEADGKENKKSKYEERIYVPAGERQPDTFVTQLTQQYSSPSRIRGPRWMKPRKSPSPSPSPLKAPAATHTVPTRPIRPAVSPGPVDDEFEADFGDDSGLLAAFEEDDDELEFLAATTGNANGITRSSVNRNSANDIATRGQALQRSTSFRQTTLHGIQTTQQEPSRTQTQPRVHNWPLANRNETPTHHEINRDAMGTWVYPTNLGRIRDYQYNIVHKGLFHNILVALPTGLGKTFIAATVMLNWYRWTKDAQIIFVAPTKPLVSQQIDACFNIVGIPRSQTTLLTGDVSPAIRAEEWQEKRVFFMTPQTLINDLKSGYCDPKKVVLLVVDEAHKATGSYAYVEVVKFLRRYNSSFRVLALTATPGKDVETVQEVIDGLGIARVEIRTEESLDIRGFVHGRNIQPEIFDNSEEITMALELLAATLQPLMNKLHSQGAAWGRDPTRITLFGLKKSWEKWQTSEAGRKAPQSVKGLVRAINQPLMSLAHNLEILKYHGIGPFYHKMKMFVNEAGNGKTAKQITDDENFKKLMNRLALWVNNPDFEGHPKLSYLKTVVLNHFMDAGEGNAAAAGIITDTRIMVFTHYRDSAEEIVRVLNRHGPMIRAHVFVGQSSTKSGSEGMKQKTQLDIIQKFKAGKYNTLVATAIGEEGLDIGEVDLIVCYDCSKSPIRMLQRMGRTGRKRAGNIVLLMMRGKEEQDFHQSEDNYQKMQVKIASGKEFNFHDELSPRIIPKEISPAVDKRIVEIPVENTQAGPVEPTRRKAKNAKKPAKKFHMPDGVETGFAFLGNGNKTSKARMKEPKTPKTKKIEVAALPALKDVLLSEIEEQQLEDRYARLAGGDDEYIQHVRLDVYPEQQRRLGKTSSVKHSRRTKNFVKAYKAMNIPGRDWDRPLNCEEIAVDDLPLKADTKAAESVSRSSTKTSKPRKSHVARSTSVGPEELEPESDLEHSLAKSKAKLNSFNFNGPSSGTIRSSSVGQYDECDSFIDDGDADDIVNEVRRRKSKSQAASTELEDDLVSLASLPSLASPVIVPAKKVKRSNPFHVSQESIDFDAMDAELPELEDLVSTKKKSRPHIQIEGAKVMEASPSSSLQPKDKGPSKTAKSRKRVRTIMDSDDDE
ncbi:3'-5' DNA helicase [Cladophialophora chaetospira]|uniref:ATP-dependent DNA helicase n=1 Tax=Cladophialophora chaetospira TaxID=386627 RepID=A0AA39CDY6_9EURO|nr:3'-5' DNA helicase [Cladophialophora chaetospira]